MATYTTNYNLTKPDTTDTVDIEVLNDNFDTIDETMADLQVATGSISLTTTWTDEGSNLYSQTVSISGATANSKIDLQPDVSVLAQMMTDSTKALWAENNNGTVTVYAYRAAPTAALTVQYTRTEVSA